MNITLLSKKTSIFPNMKKNVIKNFNLSFDFDESFYKNENSTIITIDYTISFFDKNVKFGELIASYSFEIPEAINFVTLNDDTKRNTVLYCLKSNHHNIFNLIKEELKQNNIKIKENRDSRYH